MKINGTFPDCATVINVSDVAIDMYNDNFSSSANGYDLNLTKEFVSWDTMDLDTMNKRQVGQPLRALQSLTLTEHPIPDEVMIVKTCHDTETKGCLTEQLEDAHRRIKFLESRLEKADDIIEDAFRDLERARRLRPAARS